MKHLLLVVCMCVLTVVFVWILISAAMPGDCGGLTVPERYIPFCGEPWAPPS